jgi:hypothetical protein
LTLARFLTAMCCWTSLAACPRGPHDPVDPPGASAAAGSGSAVAGSPGSPAAAAPPRLPPIELSCTADTDCAITDLQLSGPDTCCPGCGLATSGRADWVAAVHDACIARKDWIAHCLPLNCPLGVDHAACKGQRCITVQ